MVIYNKSKRIKLYETMKNKISGEIKKKYRIIGNINIKDSKK